MVIRREAAIPPIKAILTPVTFTPGKLNLLVTAAVKIPSGMAAPN
jgi:hypothetical protein